jgi:hypothetical protein
MLKAKLFGLIFALSVCCSLATAWAQPQSLVVAGVELSLGMPEEVVLSKLKGKTLAKAGSNGWMITEKSGTEILPIGGVSFKGGKLTWISRHWGNFDSGDSAVDLSLELYRVLSYLDERGESVVHISTSTAQEPGMTLKTIEVRSTERKVTIGILEGKGANSIGIQEILAAKR